MPVATLGRSCCGERGRLVVNFSPEPRGLRSTSQAVDAYDGRVVPGEDPMGHPNYWFSVAPLEQPREGTDLWAMQNGYVSLTPLQLDLTDHGDLARRDRVVGDAP